MIDKFQNIAVFFLLLIFTGSCQDLKKTEKPDDLIPEDKMIDILTELSLVHAARNYNKFKLEETGIKPDQYIYEKFDIDSLQFERSNNYYADKYSQYDRIYDSVKARIAVMKSRLDSLRVIEVKREDSIKNAERDSLNALDSLKIDKDSLKKVIKRIKPEDSLIPSPALLNKDSIAG